MPACRCRRSTTHCPRARPCCRRPARSWPTSASPSRPLSRSTMSPTRAGSSRTPRSMATASSPRSRPTDEATKAVIREIMSYVGSVWTDPGKPGMTQEKIDEFFAEAAASSPGTPRPTQTPPRFCRSGARPPAPPSRRCRPSGPRSTTTSRAAGWWPSTRRAAAALNRKEEEYLDVAAQDLSITAAEVAGFPLAQVAAESPLPLVGSVNPAYAAAIATLAASRRRAAARCPRAQLTEADWAAMRRQARRLRSVERRQAGRRRWRRSASHASARSWPGRAGRAGGRSWRATRRWKPEAASIENVERLVRYHRDLARLLHNFVNFYDFYARRRRRLPGRHAVPRPARCRPVPAASTTPAKHATMAGLAGAYLAYSTAPARAPARR